jgi:chorismate synthase
MLSINAAKGFDYGSGFAELDKTGAELNDAVLPGDKAGTVLYSTNHAGGIQGGISTGQPLYFRVAFKPVSTIAIPQQSVNKAGEAITISASGRHDPCVLPRAVPIVEAMCALVLADHLLMAKASAPMK